MNIPKYTTHDMISLGMAGAGIVVFAGTATGLLGAQDAIILLGGAATFGGFLFKQVCQACPFAKLAKEAGYDGI